MVSLSLSKQKSRVYALFPKKNPKQFTFHLYHSQRYGMCPLSPHTPLEEVVSTDLPQPSCYREACFYCVLCVQRSFHNHHHEGKGILRPKTACVIEVTYLRLCNTYNFLNVSCHFHTICPWRGDATTLQKLSIL